MRYLIFSLVYLINTKPFNNKLLGLFTILRYKVKNHGIYINLVSRKVFSSKTRLDIFADFRNLEALSVDYKLSMDSILDSTDKITNERKSRYIIEVTKENMDYCRVLMKIFDLHHLDNLKGSFILHDDKYSFISTNIKYNLDGNKEEEYDKNVELSIVTSSSTEIVKQQQKIFDTLWHNSLPADEKMGKWENGKEKIFDTSCYDFNDESLASVTSFNKMITETAYK